MEEGSAEDINAVGVPHLFAPGRSTTAPLAVLVHGRAGDRKVMLAFRRTLPDEWAVLSLEAPLRDPIGGRSWWLVEGGAPLPIPEALKGYAVFRDAVRGALAHYALAPTAVYALGFSQGAGILSIAIQRSDPPLTGVALLAGFVVPLTSDERARAGVALPRVFVAHGVRDPVVSIDEAHRGVAYLRKLGCEVEVVEDDVEHKVGAQGMRALKSWLLAQ